MILIYKVASYHYNKIKSYLHWGGVHLSSVNKRRFTGFVTMALFLSVLFGCQDEMDVAQPYEPIQVYVSFYPLYDFAKKIGGDHVDVHNIMPPGVEAHDFEPTPKDLVALADADLFVYNGAGLEAWAEKAAGTLNEKSTLIVNTAEHIGDRSLTDPHLWLDPNLAQLQAELIKDALVKIDAVHEQAYEANFNALSSQFGELDQALRSVSETAKRKEIIVSHAAFGHLTERYGLEQIAISGKSSSHEPSQKELQEIIEFAKEREISHVLFEPFVSLKIAEVVKNEIGAEALILNPLENITKEELERGEDYFSIMNQNIENLEKALNP